MHLKGRRHQENMDQSGLKSEATNQKTTKKEGKKDNLEFRNEATTQKGLNEKEESEVPTSSMIHSCKLCDIICISEKNLQDHQKGSCHQMKLAKEQKSNENKDEKSVAELLQCKLCSVNCNNSVSFENHLKGWWHQENMTQRIKEKPSHILKPQLQNSGSMSLLSKYLEPKNDLAVRSKPSKVLENKGKYPPKKKVTMQESILKSAKKERERLAKNKLKVVTLSTDDVVYINTPEQLSTLIQNYAQVDDTYVGFDAEWKPNTKYVDVIQLCFSDTENFVIHISQLYSVAMDDVLKLIDVLQRVTLVGVNIRSDLENLSLYPGIDVKGIRYVPLVNNAEKIIPDEIRKSKKNRIGLQDLFEIVVPGSTINKDLAVTLSDWSSKVLKKQQIMYAAIDAWAGLKVAEGLMKMLNEEIGERDKIPIESKRLKSLVIKSKPSKVLKNKGKYPPEKKVTMQETFLKSAKKERERLAKNKLRVVTLSTDDVVYINTPEQLSTVWEVRSHRI
jgi:hypothetical protein